MRTPWDWNIYYFSMSSFERSRKSNTGKLTAEWWQASSHLLTHEKGPMSSKGPTVKHLVLRVALYRGGGGTFRLGTWRDWFLDLWVSPLKGISSISSSHEASDFALRCDCNDEPERKPSQPARNQKGDKPLPFEGDNLSYIDRIMASWLRW